MASQAAEEMIADVQFGTVRRLKAICLHLIDSRDANRELLLADLFQAQAEVSNAAVPAVLYAELGGKSPEPRP